MTKRWMGILSGVTFMLAAASAGAQDTSEFTARERERLLAGELVRRDISRRENGRELYGGASWQLVRAPIERVWRTVNDPQAYPRLIPSLDRVRVVSEDGDRRTLYMHHSYGIGETEYHIVVRANEAEHAIRFDLDESRPHDMRAGRGFISLTPYRGHTIVSWGMLADAGGGIIMQLFAPVLNDWLLLPPRCVRDEIEPGRTNQC
jgi:carbon monoxide dehydrogenase subunit G